MPPEPQNRWAGCQATSVAANTTDVAVVAARDGLRLMGYTAREAAGTPAVASFDITNGDATDDPIIATESLIASGRAHAWFGPDGIPAPDGIFLSRLAGSVAMVVYSKVIRQ